MLGVSGSTHQRGSGTASGTRPRRTGRSLASRACPRAARTCRAIRKTTPSLVSTTMLPKPVSRWPSGATVSSGNLSASRRSMSAISPLIAFKFESRCGRKHPLELLLQPSECKQRRHVLEAFSNVDYWTKVNAEFTDADARRAWAEHEVSWGMWAVPDAELGILGDVAGLDAVELGCGTAFASAR